MRAKIVFFYILCIILFPPLLFSQNTRPQTPVPPFPYKTEEVVFFNETDSAKLSGTLTLPDKKGTFPAAVLITGSGTQNRDEEILGHKPFMVIADHLTRNGIAVLRFDDRGAGGSTLGKGRITTQSNSRDVRAALDFLKTRKEINADKIGLIGHSEGGSIAFMLAAQYKDISFIVSLAGAGLRGDKILLSQQEIYFKSYGYPDSTVKSLLDSNREYFDLVRASEACNEYFRETVSEWLKKKYPLITESQIKAQLKNLLNPWMYNFIKYDPYDDMKRVKIPVLVLNGKKDTQVISSLNLHVIEKALKEGGNSKYKIVEPEELNHLFQHSKTGLAKEYGELEETFSPEMLDVITAWILKECD